MWRHNFKQIWFQFGNFWLEIQTVDIYCTFLLNFHFNFINVHCLCNTIETNFNVWVFFLSKCLILKKILLPKPTRIIHFQTQGLCCWHMKIYVWLDVKLVLSQNVFWLFLIRLFRRQSLVELTDGWPFQFALAEYTKVQTIFLIEAYQFSFLFQSIHLCNVRGNDGIKWKIK